MLLVPISYHVVLQSAVAGRGLRPCLDIRVIDLLKFAKRISCWFRNFHYFRIPAYLKGGELHLQPPTPFTHLKRRRTLSNITK
jgi:hypothetical protein